MASFSSVLMQCLVAGQENAHAKHKPNESNKTLSIILSLSDYRKNMAKI
jgi:hypothetical protein